MLSLLLLIQGCSGPSLQSGDSETSAASDSGSQQTDTATAPTDTASGTTGDTATTSTDTATTDTGTAPLPCFADIQSPVDYAISGAVLNATCTGTNHQDIAGIERVVFVGDSITAGAPLPADWTTLDLAEPEEWYRNRLALELAARWGLEAPDWFWQNVDLTSGESLSKLSGDFANCSKWGARTDDLHKDNDQLADCIPEDARDQHNLVIMTIGGNDLYSLLNDVKDAVDQETIRAEWQEGIDDLSDAVHWLTDDPATFPGGIDVIVANIFDVTDADGAADIADCEGAQMLGLDDPLKQPFTQELVLHWQQSLLALSAETGIDVALMGENFCGHGYNWDDTTGRCYRGGDATLYLDATCEHPSPDGHAAIEALMLGVIDE